ncbi:MAG: hypothetical protein IH912_03100 [Proteobacteria bacterium]|nr:hypothetical protein [Pseudomonadota bacterium]
MHIPAKYYERIPKFYFIVGLLLLGNSLYDGLNDTAAYAHFFFGAMSIIYAVSVQRARLKHRENPPAEDSQQSPSEAPSESQAESEIRDLT